MDFFNILFAKKTGLADGSLESLFGRTIGEKYEWVLEKKPYLFRQSGGALNSRLLNKEKDKLVGASVGWNNLLNPSNYDTNLGITASYSNGLISFSGTASTTYASPLGRSLVCHTNHIYLLLYTIVSNPNNLPIRLDINYRTTGKVRTSTSCISKGQGEYNDMAVGISNITQGADYTGVTARAFLIDLTLLFGSTIADYLYTLESGTSGAGVSKLKEWGFFTEPYYPYNAGEIKSVCGLQAHEMVGKNAFNDTWADYTQPNDYRVCPIKLVKGAKYTLSAEKVGETITGCTVGIVKSGDRYMNFDTPSPWSWLNSSGVIPQSAFTYTIDDTWTDPKLVVYAANKETFDAIFENYHFQLELGETATDFEPYTKHEYALDSTLTLRGMFKLDANNNLYADGDVYDASGEVERKCAELTFDGSSDEGWSMPATGYFAIAVSNLVNDNNRQTVISNKYVGDSWTRISGLSLDMVVGVVGGATVRFRNSSITSLNDWKTWLSNNNTTIVYELATPTTETATPFTNPQTVSKYGTEEYVTNQKFVPVGHSTEYKCEPTP